MTCPHDGERMITHVVNRSAGYITLECPACGYTYTRDLEDDEKEDGSIRLTKKVKHALFFGNPKEGAQWYVEIPTEPTDEQKKNLREMLNLYYEQGEITQSV